MIEFISGVFNYHKVGINGYILRKRLNDFQGMIRVIHVIGDPILTLMNPATKDFTFAPHNHRQDVTLYGLWGNATNVTFRFDNRASGHGGLEFLFESELVDGKMNTHFHGAGDLDVTDVRPITETGLSLKAPEIHTVVARKDSAFLIVEGALATVANPRHNNFCYSYDPKFKLNTTPELYTPMAASELKDAASLCAGLSDLGAICNALRLDMQAMGRRS